MEMPKNYEAVQAYGEYTPLTLGGHIMKIVKVEEKKSRNGNDMIEIYLDTDKSDKQPQYFKQLYDNDTRPEKKWRCIVYQLVHDTQTGTANAGFKTFITAVEKSNSSSFKVLWGDKFCECFKGKLVGGVFGREQYINNKGNVVFATKCFFFRSVAAINEGVEVPADKLLDGNAPAFSGGAVITPTPQDMDTTSDDYPF